MILLNRFIQIFRTLKQKYEPEDEEEMQKVNVYIHNYISILEVNQNRCIKQELDVVCTVFLSQQLICYCLCVFFFRDVNKENKIS